MNRRSFVTAAAAAPFVARGAEAPPNVVFILVDQWRAQALGYSGDPNAHTPAIDKLASQSTSFANAVSGCPVSSPYRGSLMTGQYPLKSGVFVNDVAFEPTGATLGQGFTKAGYNTGYIGKWHLYGSPDGKFGRRLSYIPKENRFGFDYWKVCECTHNYNKSLYYAGDDPTQRYWDGYDATAQAKDACDWIEARAKSNDPFFMLLSLGPPHNPYGTAPEKFQTLVRERPFQFRRNVPESLREKHEKDLRGYYAHVAALDSCVGDVVSTLERVKRAENTILVFTSDHGDMLGSQGLQFKQVPWDESVRVPLLVRYPRRLANKRRTLSGALNTPDLMPTLLGLAGLPVPGSVQGSDMSGVVFGKKQPSGSDASLLNLPVSFSVARRFGIAEYRGLRTSRHTYVRSIHGPWLLYDNQLDPFQMKNLCDSAEHTKLRKELDAALEKRLRAAGDDFLPGDRYVDRAQLKHYGEVNAPIGESMSPWGDWRGTLSAP